MAQGNGGASVGMCRVGACAVTLSQFASWRNYREGDAHRVLRQVQCGALARA